MSIDFRPDEDTHTWDSPLVLNVANGNAVKILAILGLPLVNEGEVDPADLKGRILLARLADDDGEPDAEHPIRPGQTGARWIDCGLPPAYYSQRLDILDKIADYALGHNMKVVWY